MKIAVLGCGRIGKMHANNVHRHPRATLAMVYDVYEPAGEIHFARTGRALHCFRSGGCDFGGNCVAGA
ncbi:MAG: hypothetical protein COC00_008975 [Rhizobiales bacterium]|nr:hypothetical protein [Hyphomicrobiales bacterium]